RFAHVAVDELFKAAVVAVLGARDQADLLGRMQFGPATSRRVAHSSGRGIIATAPRRSETNHRLLLPAGSRPVCARGVRRPDRQGAEPTGRRSPHAPDYPVALPGGAPNRGACPPFSMTRARMSILSGAMRRARRTGTGPAAPASGRTWVVRR